MSDQGWAQSTTIEGETRELVEFEASQNTGNGNYLNLRQVGDFNEGNISQFGGQSADIRQIGNFHDITLTMSGFNNFLKATQQGFNNDMGVALNGLNNRLVLRQDGSYNRLYKAYTEVQNLNMMVEQRGDFNYLNVDLSSRANGNKLPMSIRQTGGARATIKHINDFQILSDNPATNN